MDYNKARNMANQNIILDMERFLDIYKDKTTNKTLKLIQKRRWLPLYTNSSLANECAYLVGKIMGDGHLAKNFCCSFIGQKDSLEQIKRVITKIFDIDNNKVCLTKRKAKGISYLLKINDVALGKLLHMLGAPLGNKTKVEFLLPNWIRISNVFKQRFLQAILEDELTSIKLEKAYHSNYPIFKLRKEGVLLSNLGIFLQELKLLLRDFNITTSEISKPRLTSNNKYDLYFKLHRNKPNIINFAEKINFRFNKRKKNSLNKCTKILKQTRNNRKPFIDKVKISELSQKGLSIRQIAKVVNLNKSTVYRTINNVP
ncbi:MAG: helix-turn-helix domain-containing protein [Candidatus Woesearchaeota archaeon]